jgi:histidinol-phosphate aminotransferase
MPLPGTHTVSLRKNGFSRRDIGRIAGLLTAGAALPFYNEFAMAQAARPQRAGGRRGMDPDAVYIDSNENPLGPCAEAVEAIARTAPSGGRYSPHGEQGELLTAIAETEGVKESYVALFAGSSDPLHRAACAFTSPKRNWVMANPGYGGGAPAFIGSGLTRVPLGADYAHDGKAMLEADPDGGVYYVCNPNNPTGTVTPRADIDYILANKKKDAVVVVDEAYIHFADNARTCNDLVAADKDVIVMRTFSKVYGMAGIRAGFAMARPDLLARLRPYGVGFLPVTGLAAATASLKVKDLVAKRKEINRTIRRNTFTFLEKKGVPYIPSQTNCFMMDMGRPHDDVAQAFAARKIYVGRMWPVWPTKVRVTVGTQEEMSRFQASLEQILA